MSVPTTLRLLTCSVLLGFLPVFNAQSNSNNCGQRTFNGSAGVIASPSYPSYYGNNQFCSYSIVATSLSTIKFTFNPLFIEPGTTCSYDWIEFTCESNSISRPIRYCGFGDRAPLIFKPCSRVLVTFNSDGSLTTKGVSVSYEIEPIRCQGACSPVANGSGYNCNCDVNQTPYIAPPYDQCPVGCFSSTTYCVCNAVQTPASTATTSTSTTTTTTTTTLPTTTTAIYNAYCGQRTFNGTGGVITSPNYPNYYQNNQLCSYSIVAPSLSVIRFKFNAVGLEQQESCTFDWIEFTCVSNSISRRIRYCGSGVRAVLSFKPCSRVLVTFSSDGSVTGIGFSVSYAIEPIRCQGDCAPVSNGSGYNCNCDANQTSYIAPPYDQCPVGCYSSQTYCACSSFYNTNSTSTSNTTASPANTTTSSRSTMVRSVNGTTTPRPATVNAQNNSGNVSQTTTRRPSNTTTTAPRPVTMIAQTTTRRPSNTTTTAPRPVTMIAQTTTRRPFNTATTAPRPVTINARNSTAGNVFQTTTRRPSNTTTTAPRPVTMIAQTTTSRPFNTTTTAPRPVTINARNSTAGNVAQTTTRRSSNVTTRPVYGK